MENKYQIRKITVNSVIPELHISWADGHHSRYPLEGLRRACPCVFCQGGHEKMGSPVHPEIFLEVSDRKLSITRIQQVGNYAIQVFWNDGHNTGIYRFERLRDMCPIENGVF